MPLNIRLDPDMGLYWFHMQPTQDGRFDRGCGVTAANEVDAIQCLDHLIEAYDLKIASCVRNIQPAAIEAMGITPQVAPTCSRGVWFPAAGPHPA